MIGSVDNTLDAASGSEPSVSGTSRQIARGVQQRLGAAGRGDGGWLDAARRKERAQLGSLRAGQKRAQRLGRQRVERRRGLCGHRGICVVGQQNQQRQLLQRARREGALRGEQTEIAADFAPAEEIEQR